MALATWNSTVAKAKSVFDGYTDEQLMQEIAPGKNRGIYLLGHLVAANDSMLTLMGGRERLHPELEQAFLRLPDRSVPDLTDVQTLRAYWDEVHAELGRYFASLSPDDWMTRHTAVSEKDFAKEPHRNKLNVLFSRTNHLSYHLGQVALIAKN
jgi:hypothetical protein